MTSWRNILALPYSVTKAQFAKNMIAREVKAWVLEQELNATLTTTRQAEYEKLNGEIVIN